MKILHTSDWHLGSRLGDKSRADEHKEFLQWLSSLVKKQKIDLIIIAGDIFDSTLPPGYALESYYQFLADVIRAGCGAVVVTGGNHDGPSTLGAPVPILESFGVKVVPGAGEEPESVVFRVETGEDSAVICGVPFLRERYVRTPVPGETPDQRRAALVDGLQDYYKRVADHAESLRKGDDIPVIGTGHLFIRGGTTSDSVRDLYAGNLGVIGTDLFGTKFDYTALGHLHEYQMPAKEPPVVYSGSPIPLSFSERSQKSVLEVHFQGRQVKEIVRHTPPCTRRMIQLSGSSEEIRERILQIAPPDPEKPYGEGRPAWLDLRLEVSEPSPGIADQLTETAAGQGAEVLKVQLVSTTEGKRAEFAEPNLEELTPEEVFRERLAVDGIEDASEELLNAFRELVVQVQQEEADEA